MMVDDGDDERTEGNFSQLHCRRGHLLKCHSATAAPGEKEDKSAGEFKNFL